MTLYPNTPIKRKCAVCKKKFAPEYDTAKVNQLICSNKCCVEYYNRLKTKTRRVAKEIAQMIGKRSIGEVEFDANNIENNKTIKSRYEPDSFQYVVEETRSYTPDFQISTKAGKVFYIEYKGILDLETRKKMVRVKHQYPDLDIRFVFQKARNKIRKGSKTTYGKWATDNGFKWADNTLPPGWLK